MLSTLSSLTAENWIAISGIFVTAIFSFLVWRATAVAGKAAHETYKLSERMAYLEQDRINEQREIMRMQLKAIVLRDSMSVEDILAHTEPKVIWNGLQTGPKKLEVSKEDLSKYFTAEEVSLITSAWDSYQNFLSIYLEKTYYFGDEIKEIVQQAGPILESMSKIKNSLMNH